MNIDSIKKDFHHIGLLANQSSWYASKNAYLVEILGEHIRRVFVPEHGFFAELQDQETLDDTSGYGVLNPYCEFVSVYGGDKHHTLKFTSSQLSDLDCIVVDIQDVGVRYFTYITTLYYLFDALKENRLSIPVFVTDRSNPNMGRGGGHTDASSLPVVYRRRGFTALLWTELIADSQMVAGKTANH
jgi:uncharacterized protein YbbC (DUF1343 family)